MKRESLAEPVRRRLKRLPPPFEAQCGVVPPPPPESAIDLRGVSRRHWQAVQALAAVDGLAAEAPDRIFVSRVLTRREAVSSSSIEGTNSTLDEMLAVEETADAETRSAARQVRDYALVLDRLIPEAARKKHDIFDLDLLRAIHAEIVKGDRDYKDAPGALRRNVV